MSSMSPVEFALRMILIVGLAVLGAGFYLLPTIVAVGRGDTRRDIAMIVVLDVLLGWSVIGWIVAMILAAPEPSSKTGPT
jgi:hypothetical protein